MKYKIIGLGAVLIAAVFAFAVSFMMTEDNGVRYIQHMHAEEKEPCASHSGSVLCTHLPIVSIETNGMEIPGRPIHDENGKTIGYTTASDGSTSIWASVNIFDNEKNNNHRSDDAVISEQILIRVRGHSSREFDKPNYYIEFSNPDGSNNPQEFLGMDSHHEWTLHGPFLDKSLIRNYMWYNIAGEIMDYSPNVRFCEVILNGEYRGLYLATETITAGRDGARLSLEVNKKDNTFSGYAFRMDWGDTDESHLFYPFANYTLRAGTQHEIVYPGTKNLNDELKEAIKDDLSIFEKTLYSYDYNSEKYGYENYIDVDSFVDYFLINELTCNYDAGALSTYMYKEVDGKYRMCVWDFNSACDFYQEDYMPRDEFWLQWGLWYTMLFKDEDFTDRVIERYHELRKTYFSEEYLYKFIDETVLYLGNAIDRNYERWGYTLAPEYDLLTPSERNPRIYGEAVQQIKDFLNERLTFMDENIDTLNQYSAESKIKKYNEVAN